MSPGDRHNRLTAIRKVAESERGGMWEFACDCGEVIVRKANRVMQGDTKSCGCLMRRCNGRSSHPLYCTWNKMIARCCNPASDGYRSYGARGISVCERWRASFESFVEDMGPRPPGDVTLDRIDNSGNYEPGNVRWATRRVQQNNTRRTMMLTVDGKTMSAWEWSVVTGVPQSVIIDRKSKLQWPDSRAVSAPVRSVRKKPQITNTVGANN